MYTYHFDWNFHKCSIYSLVALSFLTIALWYCISVALFVAQMPNLLHFGASYLGTIEVEIGFLCIRCVQWQDLDVMTRCSDTLF
jgi:hypothetical protein